ncbi:10167_t:CDS:1, partial [Ambispora gerdemannii]
RTGDLRRLRYVKLLSWQFNKRIYSKFSSYRDEKNVCFSRSSRNRKGVSYIAYMAKLRHAFLESESHA